MIIANLSALGMSDGKQAEHLSKMLKQVGRDVVAQEIYSAIVSQFNDQTECVDTYLYNPSAEDLSNNIVFGIEDPKTVTETAARWNEKIQQQTLDAIKNALPELEQGVMDTQKTYALSCAARMADNHWFWTADCGTYIDRKDELYPIFKVLLKEEDVKDITTHPQQYILISVSPK